MASCLQFAVFQSNAWSSSVEIRVFESRRSMLVFTLLAYRSISAKSVNLGH
jgi:hypothetical protein